MYYVGCVNDMRKGQIHPPQIKNYSLEMENTLGEINTRLDTIGERLVTLKTEQQNKESNLEERRVHKT